MHGQLWHAYTMIIYQVKDFIDVYSVILHQTGENDGYFDS